VKLFGRYLVDEDVITEVDLLKGLIEQVKKMPTVAEVVYETKVFSHSTLLDIIEHQSRHKSPFLDSAKALGVLTPECEIIISTSILESRIPLGQILVKNGSMTLSELTTNLDNFMVDHEEEIAAETKASSAEAPTDEAKPAETKKNITQIEPPLAPEIEPEKEPEPEIQTIAGPIEYSDTSTQLRESDLDFEMAKIDPTLIESYSDLLDESKRNSLDELFSKLSSDINEFQQTAIKVNLEISDLKAGSRFINAKLTEYLFSLQEYLLISICTGPGVFSVDDIDDVKNLLASCLEETWNLRVNLVSLNSESSYWETPNSRNRMLALEDRFKEKIASYSGVPFKKAG